MEDAVRRRLPQELGVEVGDLTLRAAGLRVHRHRRERDRRERDLPGLRRPVWCIRTAPLGPNPVKSWTGPGPRGSSWWPPSAATPFVFSPWAVAQVRELPGAPPVLTGPAPESGRRETVRRLRRADDRRPCSARPAPARAARIRRPPGPSAAGPRSATRRQRSSGSSPLPSRHAAGHGASGPRGRAARPRCWRICITCGDQARRPVNPPTSSAATTFPRCSVDLVDSGGKRIRPVMAYLGWLSASGRRRGVGHADVVRVECRAGAAAPVRAGARRRDGRVDLTPRPADGARCRPADLHRRTARSGRAERFGENIAILLGDLAHAEADAPGRRAAGRDATDLAVAGDRARLRPAARPDRQRRRAARPGPRPRRSPDSKSGGLHRGATAPARAPRPRGRRRWSPRPWPRTAARWARPSPCATTCSASGAIRTAPASPPATT